MNSWLIFLLKSTLILSSLYLFFRLLLRNESFFNQSRIVLVLIVLSSAIIPFIYLPNTIHAITSNKLTPIFQNSTGIEESVNTYDNSEAIWSSAPVPDAKQPSAFTIQRIVLYVYLAGAFISFLLFVKSLFSVFFLIGKSRRRELKGIRIVVVNNDIPAFSFGKYILLSQYDYETNSKAILAHELSHIKQWHFYDLMLMELVKIIYWFNPLVYFMNRDIKEIHEFQADAYTLNSGIDATKYQLLIIQKCVGHQKFALANSFNHCQIKNRITMMNKSKNSKEWSWKVAAFLPLLVFLLMAFGRKSEIIPDKRNLPEKGNQLGKTVSSSELTQKRYEQFSQKIEIKRDGNYIDNKLCSMEEIALQGQEWRNSSNDWIFLLIDESVPFNRIDEVREALNGNYWVIQTTVNSDELVYYAGDVSKLAKFRQGKWSDWMKSQLNSNPEIKTQTREYKLSYSFIIDKNGKVRDGHVIKGCEYPEINSAFEKILSQIPDWEPAMRGNDRVSVYKSGVFHRKSKMN